MTELSEPEILREASTLALSQPGGTLATVHSEDATPYVTYVLFHLLEDGHLLFGSGGSPQHARNIRATPEVSFLIDNREAVKGDWNTFDRVVIEGRAEIIPTDDPRYEEFLAAMGRKDERAAFFIRRGDLFCVSPRRLIMMKGLQPQRHIVDFAHDG